MKFIRLVMYQDTFQSINPNRVVGEIEVEVAGINLRVTMKEEVVKSILVLIQPDLNARVMELRKEIDLG